MNPRMIVRTLLLAVVFALAVGCATRGGTATTTLHSDAESIHNRLAAVIDRLPENHPLRAELVAILDSTGNHRDRCWRVEVQMRLINATMAIDDLLTNGVAGFEIRVGGSAKSGP